MWIRIRLQATRCKTIQPKAESLKPKADSEYSQRLQAEDKTKNLGLNNLEL